MNRREFIAFLAASSAWPMAAEAQQTGQMRRIGVLMGTAADDPRAPASVASFAQGLGELGWSIGRNVQIDYRWAPGDADHRRAFAAELVALNPDVILAFGGLSVGPLLQITRSIPIIFVGVTDPVGGGLVASLARPGGNATGFSTVEYSVSVKWLELLKELAPRVTRVAVLRNTTIAGAGQFGAIQGVASSFGVEVRPVDPGDAVGIERTLTAFVREPNAGLIVTVGGLAPLHRDLIIALAAKLGIPAIYPSRFYPESGGLLSYGPDSLYQYRQAAGYVDRILKGAKPADLPVQNPTKYELVVNLKAVKSLGITISPMFLARADGVIE